MMMLKIGLNTTGLGQEKQLKRLEYDPETTQKTWNFDERSEV